MSLGIPITLITGYEHLSIADIDELRAQDVAVEDWDLMLVCEFEKCEGAFIDTDGGVCSDNYQLDRILNRVACYDPKWFVVNFRGQKVLLGIAYH